LPDGETINYDNMTLHEVSKFAIENNVQVKALELDPFGNVLRIEFVTVEDRAKAFATLRRDEQTELHWNS
jgi:hypothetical protein